MIKTRKNGFYPTCSMEGKQNYKKFLRIERDGSVAERIFLNVSNVQHREQLICLHYLLFMAQNIFDEDLGVNILDRDNPWDFKLELSNGKKFNLEITAIADSEEHFIINKREERLAHWRDQEHIPFHELKKLGDLFPNTELIEIIQKFASEGIKANDEIENPLYNTNEYLMLSSMLEPPLPLENLLKIAIEKKRSKNHLDKENTVLLIDNRTSFFDTDQYQTAAHNIEDYLHLTKFKEIWFYTGYCSDDDGTNAEFSFAPLKIPNNYRNRIRDLMKLYGIDNHGRLIV